MLKPALFTCLFLSAQLFFTGINISYNQPKDISLRFGNTFEEILKYWNLKTIVGQAEYEVIRRENGNVLHILSNNSASILFKKMDIDIYNYPHIRWHWQVNKFPKYSLGSLNENDIDDYAARLCVVFPSWSIMTTKFLVYVWDDRVNEQNVVKPSSFSKNCKILVTQCGKGNKGKWVTEERNILEDYRMVFGKKPPKTAGGIGIMSDSDDTKTSTDASYYNIYLRYKD